MALGLALQLRPLTRKRVVQLALVLPFPDQRWCNLLVISVEQTVIQTVNVATPGQARTKLQRCYVQVARTKAPLVAGIQQSRKDRDKNQPKTV